MTEKIKLGDITLILDTFSDEVEIINDDYTIHNYYTKSKEAYY